MKQALRKIMVPLIFCCTTLQPLQSSDFEIVNEIFVPFNRLTSFAACHYALCQIPVLLFYELLSRVVSSLVISHVDQFCPRRQMV